MRTDHIYAIPDPFETNEFETFFVREEYLHFDGDSLFWWKENEFRLLLCFSCDSGDTWNPLPMNEVNQDCDSSGFYISQKDSVEYDGIWYRRISIEVDNYETSPIFWTGTFDERTFGREAFYPEYNICGSIIEWLSFSFMCYSDGELSFPEPNTVCSSLLLSSEEPILKGDPTVFPNPLLPGEELMVDRYDILRFFDMNGKLVMSHSSSQGKVVPTLPSGIYIIEIERRNAIQRSKVAVR